MRLSIRCSGVFAFRLPDVQGFHCQRSTGRFRVCAGQRSAWFFLIRRQSPLCECVPVSERVHLLLPFVFNLPPSRARSRARLGRLCTRLLAFCVPVFFALAHPRCVCVCVFPWALGRGEGLCGLALLIRLRVWGHGCRLGLHRGDHGDNRRCLAAAARREGGWAVV